MISIILLDAGGASKRAFYEWAISFILAPFIFAFGMVLFFRLLDRFSKKADDDGLKEPP
jgi:hypothetical protein